MELARMRGMRRLQAGDVAAERGFSLLELLTVVGIMMVLAAVSIPMIGQYIRNYQIRAAAQQVAGYLTTARFKAISKNVNLGVVFAVTSPTQCQYAIEDDMSPQTPHPPDASNWSTIGAEHNANWALMLTDVVQAGPVLNLPTGVRFDSTANCPALGTFPALAAPTDWGFRFGHFGTACQFNNVNMNCGNNPPNPPAYVPYINYVVTPGGTTTGDFAVCLWQPVTNLRLRVTVQSGGRVVAP